MSKKYLDTVGLNGLVANILSRFAAKNHKHSAATTTQDGFMSANDKVKLDGIANGANKTIVDSTLSDTSINPIQNKVVKKALDGKASSSHTHPTAQITGLDSALAGKANASHTHDDRYYTETEMNNKLDAKADVGHVHTIDSSLSSTSVNPVQNKVINSALAGKVPTTRTINGKALSANISITAADVGADASGAANSALVSAKSYTDGKVANLLNNSTEAVDSIMELADAMKTNKDAIDSLNSIAASKANASDLNAHKTDATVHVTSTERNNWNAAKTHAGTAHAPANAQANQNAFSNVTVGSTTIAADTQTDNLTLAGSNVTLTPDATNDKITIGLTKANVTSALGYTPPTTNTTYGVGTASSLGLTKLYTGAGTAVDGTMTQNAITSALGGKADKSHTHTISNVTNLQTELDKKQDKTQPVTASGTGAAYIASVPHIKTLATGVSFTMIPNVVSTNVSPTLNVNGLGAKQIRQRLSNGTVSTATGATANWLAAGKPVDVMYDGAFWVVDFVRPNMASAYGTLPVANGGTGATTAEQARKNLGFYKTLWAGGGWTDGNVSVSDTLNYRVFAARVADENSPILIGIRNELIESGAAGWIRFYGYYRWDNANAMLSGFSATYQNNTWTHKGMFTTATNSSHSSWGPNKTVEAIYGIC